MVRPDVIHKRLMKVEEYLAILQGMRRHSREAFLKDPEKYGSAERFLQLAIEALADMGSHVIADLDLGPVDSTADIPRILAEKEYLPEALCEKWIRMIGFRNILVHEYLEIDRNTVYDVLRDHLNDVLALSQAFRRFI